MYRFRTDQVLDEKFLTRLVEKFRAREVREYDRMDRYYGSENDAIRLRGMKQGKPNNKIPHGFARYISNMATSYFMGRPVRYQVDDAEYSDAIQDYLKDSYNFNYEISKAASKKGVAFELLYVNEKSELRSRKYEAQEILPVYSPSTDEFLECAVHLWENRDLDGNLLLDGADVYDRTDIWSFRRRNKAALYELHGVEPHHLSDVPVIVYWNNEEQTGDYRCVIPAIDAYDRAQSNTANDKDYFTDAYLVVKGSGGFTDEEGGDIPQSEAERNLRNSRVMFLDEKGDAKFLVKQTDGTEDEAYKNRIFRDIFFISQVPAMTDESFSGDLSGIAIRYKLMGLEQLAIMKENKFRLAQQKKIRIVTDWINLKYSRNYDASLVQQIYERNFVDNDTEKIGNAAKAEGMVSRETQLSMMPSSVVPDAKEELERMAAEKQAEELEYMEEEQGDEAWAPGSRRPGTGKSAAWRTSAEASTGQRPALTGN